MRKNHSLHKSAQSTRVSIRATALACWVAGSLSYGIASVTYGQSYPLTTLHGLASLSYQSIELPNHGGDLGLAGLDYRVKVHSHFYAGAGVQASVKGDQGGLFLLGLEGGFIHPLYGPISVDTGVFVGAGGGSNESLHSAILLNPHLGLLWNMGAMDLGVGYSWAKFVASDIHSGQWRVTVGVPLNIKIASASLAGVEIDDPNLNQFPNASPYASTHELSGVTELFFPMHGTRNRENDLQDGTMVLVGARYQTSLHGPVYGVLQTEAAVHGLPSGYKQFLTGVGWNVPVYPGLTIAPELGVGAGGGGEVNTGGGLIVAPKVDLRYRVSQNWDLGLGAGYLYAPNGHFHAWTTSFSVGYRVHTGGLTQLESNAQFSQVVFHQWQFSLNNEHLFSVVSTSNGASHGTDMVSMQASYFPVQHTYFAVNLDSSYRTRDAGFQVGLLGAGYVYPVESDLNVFGEAFLGAAGGGDVRSGDDAVGQVDVGARWMLTSAWSLAGTVGRLQSLKSGGIGSNLASIGVTYSLTQMEGVL